MATKTKKKPLSEIEWDTCWMAIRYARGRKTISSAMLPREILNAYYLRFTDNQKSMLYRDLKQYKDDHENFGSTIDEVEWTKFMLTLNPSCHYYVRGKIGSQEPFEVFEYEDKLIPIDWYKGVGEIWVHRDAVEKVEQ